MSAEDLLYFVGSVPLTNAEDVFRELNASVGKYLKRANVNALIDPKFPVRSGV